MRNQILGVALFSLLMVSCASIPKETVTLSTAIGSDLQILHGSHRKVVQLYYEGIKSDVNTFIDDVYAPYIIHFVLESELDKYKNGESSIYGIIEKAGKTGGKAETEDALNVMLEFQEAANKEINSKRDELLSPILSQETEILKAVDEAYQNTIYANTNLTAYLSSARKVKESQSEALSVVGLEGMDTTVTDKLVELSGFIDTALKEGEKIDIKSDKAQQQINDIIDKIKKLTNKIAK